MKILIDGPDQILYQWDKGQRLMLHGADSGTRVDFARCDQHKAVSVYAYAEDGAVFCDIPDSLLMDPNHLHGYVYEIDGDRGETVREFMLPVIRRPMPEDYVAPDEVPTWHELEQRIKKIEDEGVPDEKIERAVEDYLEENPIEAPKPDLTGVVKSVNGKTPDENGNVEITIPDSSQNGDGLTGTEKTLILSLFRNAAYTADMSATFAQLEALWGGSGGEEPDVPDSPDEPDVPTYTVTNNLTNVTTDNTAESIEGGKLYTANLTAEAGYTIDRVVVTMGGVEISAYGDGVISIDSVTGDVVITATAVQTNTGAAVYELAEATAFDGTSVIDTGYQLDLAKTDWSVCVDFTGTAGQVFGTHGVIDAQELRVHLVSGVYWQASLCGQGVNGYTKNNGGGKYIITHNSGETTMTAYHVSSGAVTSTSGANNWNSASGNPTTLKLGGNRTGTASFVGTINRFAIYERVLTADEISEFVGVA